MNLLECANAERSICKNAFASVKSEFDQQVRLNILTGKEYCEVIYFDFWR